MAWGKNGTPDTFASAAAEASITDLTANIFNQFMCHSYSATSAGALWKRQFNSDTASVYANRYSANGASDGTAVSQSNLNMSNNTNYDHFQLIYESAIVGEEKLGIEFLVEAGVAGAGNAPNRREFVSKYVPSPDAPITGIQMGSSGTAGISSNLSALGSDLTPVAAADSFAVIPNVQVGSRFEETDTRKMYHYESGLKYEDNFSSNGDWVFTTSNASITGGVLQCTQYRSANDSATVSVGTSIGTKFLQQFEYEVDSYPSSNGSNAWYGLWSLPNTTGANTGGQDFVVLLNNDGVNHKISVGQNTSAYGGTGSTGSTWIVLTVGTKYYIELIGNGDDTYTLNIRTVSHTGSHVTNSPQTVTKTGLSNLQYFGFKNTTGGGNGGTVTKTDDLKIYKGITTAGNVWSEEGT
jgi:hypothetical protein